MIIDQTLSAKIREQLQYGDVKKIAKKCKCSMQLVSHVLDGKRNDRHKILMTAVKMIKVARLKEKEEQLKTELQEVLCQ